MSTTLAPPATATDSAQMPPLVETPTDTLLLVRYGQVPEVVRALGPAVARGTCVVLQTPHGWLSGEVLEQLRVTTTTGEPLTPADGFGVLGLLTSELVARERLLQRQAANEFEHWRQRIAQWGLELELVELEFAIDEDAMPILYVLSSRGPDTTRLALQSAADGYGLIAVRPVGPTGPVVLAQSGGGCGTGGSKESSGGCGCG